MNSSVNFGKHPVVIIEDNLSSSNLNELKRIARVVPISPYAPQEEWLKHIGEAVAIINRKAVLTKDIMAKAHKLRMIARTGIGVDDTRIHMETAVKKDILITYNPGVNSDSVAELTILLALSVYRKIIDLDRKVREGKWNEGQKMIGNRLRGKTWGIIGYGRVGIKVSDLARAFGARVIAYDPYVNPLALEKTGIGFKEMNPLIKESDIISIHVPLQESTRHLIGKGQFDMMKKDTIILNVSRGGIIDDKALYAALKENRVKGAGLDTLEDEPASHENPLLQLSNVVLTPHIGGSTFEDVITGMEMAVTEVMNFLNGIDPINPFPYKK